MKTSNCKTAQFPRIKRLSKYICAIVVLCSINLAVIKAEEPPKETTLQTDKNPRLQMMYIQIYNNALALLELARINQLTNFRSLKKGQKLQFPTIDKEADSDNE